MIENASTDALAQASPDSDAASEVAERYGEATNMRRFSNQKTVTELDALISYLQILGQMTQAAYTSDQKEAE